MRHRDCELFIQARSPEGLGRCPKGVAWGNKPCNQSCFLAEERKPTAATVGNKQTSKGCVNAPFCSTPALVCKDE